MREECHFRWCSIEVARHLTLNSDIHRRVFPKILISVIANIYKLKENNIIPAINKYPEKLKLNSKKFLANKPFSINPIE